MTYEYDYPDPDRDSSTSHKGEKREVLGSALPGFIGVAGKD